MNGAAVVMLVLAFLPAFLPLSQGQLAATIGVGLLCVVAAFALPLFVIPGVVLWFVALFIGMWSANGAKQDRQHRALLQTMTARQGRDPVFDARCRSYVKGYKPAFSNRAIYKAEINGEKRKFWTEWEAIDFVASRIVATEAAPQIGTPERTAESYKGVRYVVCSDYSITAHTNSGTEAFPSMFAFRAWVDGNQNDQVRLGPPILSPVDNPRRGHHGIGSATDNGIYAGYKYNIYENGCVVATFNGSPHTWRNTDSFMEWANQQHKGAN